MARECVRNETMPSGVVTLDQIVGSNLVKRIQAVLSPTKVLLPNAQVYQVYRERRRFPNVAFEKIRAPGADRDRK
jgi:hypothetical protein